jgi:hypothetical protein
MGLIWLIISKKFQQRSYISSYFSVNLLIYKFFLQLRKIWADKKTIDSFFKKKYANHLEVDSDTLLNRPLATDLNASVSSVTDERPSKCLRILPE